MFSTFTAVTTLYFALLRFTSLAFRPPSNSFGLTIDYFCAIAPFAEYFLDDIIMFLRPKEPFFELPSINNITHEIECIALGMFEKMQQISHLCAGCAEVNIRNPYCPKAQRKRREGVQNTISITKLLSRSWNIMGDYYYKNMKLLFLDQSITLIEIIIPHRLCSFRTSLND